MKKHLQLFKLFLIAAVIMLCWKWATCLVLELSEVNYDLTEKVLRFTVLGGIALLIIAVIMGVVWDIHKR